MLPPDCLTLLLKEAGPCLGINRKSHSKEQGTVKRLGHNLVSEAIVHLPRGRMVVDGLFRDLTRPSMSAQGRGAWKNDVERGALYSWILATNSGFPHIKISLPRNERDSSSMARTHQRPFGSGASPNTRNPPRRPLYETTALRSYPNQSQQNNRQYTQYQKPKSDDLDPLHFDVGNDESIDTRLQEIHRILQSAIL